MVDKVRSEMCDADPEDDQAEKAHEEIDQVRSVESAVVEVEVEEPGIEQQQVEGERRDEASSRVP